jgi:phenylalanyl-tRNA synthetase beta chain
VEAGQKVLVATVGSTVYPSKGEPFKISKSKIRGEVSEGMICAEDELGLGNSHAGIMVLPPTCETGKKANVYFPVYTDYLIEIGLTANRGDAASHLGVARDLRALTQCTINMPETALTAHTGSPKPVSVTIEDTEGCLRYSGIRVSGVQVKESPEWMKNRLKVIGLTPINNIVDATNYVLHELGQPLHAFDADKLSGQQIIVRKVPPGTKFITLDKTERKLNGQECMICDAEKPLAIGGVFGGLDSGISESTREIFIESACFKPVSIRKTAKFHGLNTDASFRFERGTDPNMTIDALKRVTRLILEIAGGEVSSEIVDSYPMKIGNEVVELSIDRFNCLIGQVIPLDEVKRILVALDIAITAETPSSLTLSVPPYRSDVKREVDVAEEILRIYGLNRIAIPSQIRSAIVFSEDEPQYKLRNKLSDYLSACGFLEIINNSLTKSAYYTGEELKHAVHILNPLSNDLDIMRMSMLFGGLESIQHNRNRKATNLKFYEFGYTYFHEAGKYTEIAHFSLLLCGMKHSEGWNSPQKPVSYFTLKTVLLNMLEKSGIPNLTFEYANNNSRLDHYTTILSDGKVLADFGTVKLEIAAAFDCDDTVYFADLNWKNMAELSLQSPFRLKPVSPFPHVRRDLALLLERSVHYTEIEKIVLGAEPKLIRNITVFDVYEGDKIEQGKKSYAISFILQDEQKTLTEAEIDGVMTKLIRKLEKDLGATLRS